MGVKGNENGQTPGQHSHILTIPLYWRSSAATLCFLKAAHTRSPWSVNIPPTHRTLSPPLQLPRFHHRDLVKRLDEVASILPNAPVRRTIRLLSEPEWQLRSRPETRSIQNQGTQQPEHLTIHR